MRFPRPQPPVRLGTSLLACMLAAVTAGCTGSSGGGAPAAPTTPPSTRAPSSTAGSTAPASSATSGTAATTAGARFCAYSAHSITELDDFDALVGRQVNCAILFNDEATSWANWSSPWFLNPHRAADSDWLGWMRASAGRTLVLTQALIPAQVDKDWLQRGAAGAYDAHARTLAANLVKAGLGTSSIRLGHEANGTWYADAVPGTPTGEREWRTFWARTVTAMRSVAGAHFSFVWNVAHQVRDLSLVNFYPGDRYVDVIGLDAYDFGTANATGSSFTALAAEPGGLNDVMRFARAHHKPFAVPEWGLLPHGSQGRGRDDPSYVDGIARITRSKDVAFSGYWYAHSDTMSLLRNSPASLAALRKHYGAAGDSVG